MNGHAQYTAEIGSFGGYIWIDGSRWRAAIYLTHHCKIVPLRANGETFTDLGGAKAWVRTTAETLGILPWQREARP